MNKGRETKQTFARVYFGIRLGIIGKLPSRITTKLRNLKTIAVDTMHLSDGTQTFVDAQVYGDSSSDIRDTAYRATASSTRPLMRGLHHALATPSVSVLKPVETGTGVIEWSAWHHGEAYEMMAASGVAALLDYCDISENEREQILLQARKLSSGSDHLVYGVAKGIVSEASPSLHSLKFDGLIATTLHLLPGTRDAISSLQRRGIRLVYLSGEPEDIATFVADAVGMTAHPKVARHGAYVSSTDHAVYAHVTRIRARKILAGLPQPIIVARHPLAELVRMFDSFR